MVWRTEDLQPLGRWSDCWKVTHWEWQMAKRSIHPCSHHSRYQAAKSHNLCVVFVSYCHIDDTLYTCTFIESVPTLVQTKKKKTSDAQTSAQFLSSFFWSNTRMINQDVHIHIWLQICMFKLTIYIYSRGLEKCLCAGDKWRTGDTKPGCFWTGAETQVASQKHRTEKPSLGHGRISPGIRCGANFQFCRRVLCWQWQRHKILDSKLVEWTQHFLEMADPLHLCGPVPNYNISGAEQQ